MGPNQGVKIHNFSLGSLCRKGSEEAGGDHSFSSDVESTAPETRGTRLGYLMAERVHEEIRSGPSTDTQANPVKPTSIIKPGIVTSSDRPLRSSESPSTAPRNSLDEHWNSVDHEATHNFIIRRSTELARINSMSRISSNGQATNSSTTYVAVSDRKLSSRKQSATSSPNQSEISAGKQSEEKVMINEMQPTDDSKLHLSTTGRDRAIVDSTVGPPLPRQDSKEDQHFGSDNKLRRFSAEELLKVTNRYSTDNWFGYQLDQLFKGVLDGHQVYVARREAHERFKVSSEVGILQTIRHPNIVSLIGYCDEDDNLALVFDFVCNRCLAFHLDVKNLRTMLWQHRANLAIQLAKGLLYLHDNRIVHGNVNSLYVFLHRDFTPLIAQFSLARRVADGDDVVFQDRSGDEKARGYLAPEYEPGGKLSMEQDVYAFGVILFELITGRPAFNKSNKVNKNLGEWARGKVELFDPSSQCCILEEIMDERLMRTVFDKCDVLRMAKVAALCTKKDPKERPFMAEILQMLCADIQSTPSPSVTVPQNGQHLDAGTTLHVTESEGKVHKTLTAEAVIERNHSPEQLAALQRRVHWADDGETGAALSSSDKFEESLRKSYMFSERTKKFFGELKATCEKNMHFAKAQAEDLKCEDGECQSWGSFNYFQGRAPRPMRPPLAPARKLRMPPTLGHRSSYKTRLRSHLCAHGAGSRPGSPGSSYASSPRRILLANSGAIPMSPVRVNFIIRYHERSSNGANASKTQRKRFANPGPSPIGVRLLD